MSLSNQQLRAIARGKGETEFLPSTPCIRGHLTARRVDNSCCTECMRITALRRYHRKPKALKRRGDAAWREAKTRGDVHYFPSKPCRKGHMSERWVRGRHCIECETRQRPGRLAEVRERNREEGKRQQNGPRQEALARGEKFYFTGRPCSNGHISHRYADRKTCVTCERTWRTKWSRAMPPWADQNEIGRIYANCPEGYDVDHIVPLKGKLVSGLHVPANLQYLPSQENRQKKNKFEPQFITANA